MHFLEVFLHLFEGVLLRDLVIRWLVDLQIEIKFLRLPVKFSPASEDPAFLEGSEDDFVLSLVFDIMQFFSTVEVCLKTRIS